MRCSIKLLRKWLYFYTFLLISIYGILFIILIIDTGLNFIVLLLGVITTIIILIAKYLYSRWWIAEVLVERKWLFLKIWKGWDYFEILPRKIERIDNSTIKVIGDPWRFYTQGFLLRFYYPDEASIIFTQLELALKK